MMIQAHPLLKLGTGTPTGTPAGMAGGKHFTHNLTHFDCQHHKDVYLMPGHDQVEHLKPKHYYLRVFQRALAATNIIEAQRGDVYKVLVVSGEHKLVSLGEVIEEKIQGGKFLVHYKTWKVLKDSLQIVREHL